jgi:hypothetical protein
VEVPDRPWQLRREVEFHEADVGAALFGCGAGSMLARLFELRLRDVESDDRDAQSRAARIVGDAFAPDAGTAAGVEDAGFGGTGLTQGVHRATQCVPDDGVGMDEAVVGGG